MDNTKSTTLRAQLSNWLNSALGKTIVAKELQQLTDILPNLFGYHILQYGYAAALNYIASSRIATKTILFLDDAEVRNNINAIHGRAEELPIATDSIDVIVLPHILEYSTNPHKLLREMDRILMDDGAVVIIGFNPLSLWGLWHLFLCWFGEAPWSGRLLSIPKIKDWLSLLDFEVGKTRCFFFSPPLRNETALKKLLPLEKLGHYFWSPLGGLYIIVAKKRVVPLNLIKMQWQTKRSIINVGAIEPTTRNKASEKLFFALAYAVLKMYS